MPDHYAAPDAVAGRLRPIRPDLFGTKALFQAATVSESKTEPMVALFLDLLAAEMEAVKALQEAKLA